MFDSTGFPLLLGDLGYGREVLDALRSPELQRPADSPEELGVVLAAAGPHGVEDVWPALASLELSMPVLRLGVTEDRAALTPLV